MAEISIQLAGGEQDGFRDKLETDGGFPALVYVWRATDDEKMRRIEGDARKVLADRLGVLAYRYLGTVEKPELPGGVEFLYTRAPEMDKKLTSK
jgi:hypothetical protein